MISNFNFKGQKISPHGVSSPNKPPHKVPCTYLTCETYVSELQSHFEQVFSAPNLYALLACTNSGKSTLFRNLEGFERVFFCLPTKIAGEQQKEELQRLNAKANELQNEGIPFVILNSDNKPTNGLLNAIQGTKVVLCTRNYLAMLLRQNLVSKSDILVIDEAHKLTLDTYPNAKELWGEIAGRKVQELCPVVLSTGTPNYAFLEAVQAKILHATQTNPPTAKPKGKVLSFEPTKGKSIKKALPEIVETFFETVQEGEKVAVFCNKASALRYCASLRKNSAVMTSQPENEAEKETRESLLRGEWPKGVQILFCTSTLYEAVNVLENAQHVLFVGENSPANIVQGYGRFRRGVEYVTVCLSTKGKPKDKPETKEELLSRVNLLANALNVNAKAVGKTPPVGAPKSTGTVYGLELLQVNTKGEYEPNLAAIFGKLERSANERRSPRELAQILGFEYSPFAVEVQPSKELKEAEKQAEKDKEKAFEVALPLALEFPKEAAVFCALQGGYFAARNMANTLFKGFGAQLKAERPLPESLQETFEGLSQKEQSELKSAVFWVLKILCLVDIESPEILACMDKDELKAVHAKLHGLTLLKRSHKGQALPHAVGFEVQVLKALRNGLYPKTNGKGESVAGAAFGRMELEEKVRQIAAEKLGFCSTKNPEKAGILVGENAPEFLSQIFDVQRVTRKNATSLNSLIIYISKKRKRQPSHLWRLERTDLKSFASSLSLRPKSRPVFTNKEGGAIC